ncbi:MAG: zinc metallopeptidase [Oscillospiraceae bacterium]|nr:zinc metallopeptidase [Oscillospiraceae bacterium]MBQ5748772.1 zinc metallopeptidase [Oscillospiraceae bacterium]
MPYMDWTYMILVLPAIIFSLWASARVNSTFKRHSQQRIGCGMTGAEAARLILAANGLHHVRIERISGELTDHFDPKSNVVRLSQSVYDAATTAAVGVAAHECGHAVQHAVGYGPIKLRTAIVPVTNIGARLSFPLVLLGIFLSYSSADLIMLAYIGVILFSLSTFFQLITLPTEYNASRRAMQALSASNRLSGEELRGAKKVLSAAALTYVAALAVSAMQLISLLLRVQRNDRRR